MTEATLPGPAADALDVGRPPARDVRRVTLIAHGDRATLAEFYETRATAVLAYCSRLCAPQHTADAVEAAFSELFEAARRGEVVDDGQLDSRLCRAVRFAAAARMSATASVTEPGAAPLGRLLERFADGSGCELVPRLLAAGADGELARDDEQTLEHHLERCADCRAKADRLDDAERALALLVPATTPSRPATARTGDVGARTAASRGGRRADGDPPPTPVRRSAPSGDRPGAIERRVRSPRPERTGRGVDGDRGARPKRRPPRTLPQARARDAGARDESPPATRPAAEPRRDSPTTARSAAAPADATRPAAPSGGVARSAAGRTERELLRWQAASRARSLREAPPRAVAEHAPRAPLRPEDGPRRPATEPRLASSTAARRVTPRRAPDAASAEGARADRRRRPVADRDARRTPTAGRAAPGVRAPRDKARGVDEAPSERAGRRRVGLGPRARRRLSIVLAIAGVLLIVEAAVTVLWEEPITSYLASLAQDGLRTQLQRLEHAPPRLGRAEQRSLAAIGGYEARVDVRLALLAADVGRRTRPGQALGSVSAPAIGIDFVFVQGTDAASLRKGPGHYLQTPLPGEQGTVGIAGHRTTYLAPFRDIDQLHRGDRIIVTMPYGRFTYSVEGHRIVRAGRTDAFRDVGHPQLVLSACHPLYSASHRILVTARLVARQPLGAGDSIETAGGAAGAAQAAQQLRALGTRVLALDDSGADVRELQYLLGVPISGYFGYETESAVEDFERGQGMRPDGIADEAVKRLLAQRARPPLTPPTPPAVAPAPGAGAPAAPATSPRAATSPGTGGN